MAFLPADLARNAFPCSSEAGTLRDNFVREAVTSCPVSQIVHVPFACLGLALNVLLTVNRIFQLLLDRNARSVDLGQLSVNSPRC